jgi:hypothetical protein
MIAPSGEQLELRAGDQRAVVVEVGAGLRAYSAAGGSSSTATASRRRARPGAARC